ncbi:hypothetical protein LTR62_006896 [Meristemomyces frigidus]|uniref:Uncharacterized protein n=1 Tax=Meristemomyces frigidus TaxID=1508187 RepID=A0AAN7TCD9_9PEZI|nr:hypothetical protein LTR62_006896 [Meristemomyces frigidus]
MENAAAINALLKQLDAQRDAYQDTFRQIHEVLAHNLAATVPSGVESLPPLSPVVSDPPASPRQSISGTTAERTKKHRKYSGGLATLTTATESKRTGGESDSDDDDDQELYASHVLEPAVYGEEDLRAYLPKLKYTQHTTKVLQTIIDNPKRMTQSPLIPVRKGPLDDRSHLSHYQIFDVGVDGSLLQVERDDIETELSRAQAIWHAMKEVNKPPKERLAIVGEGCLPMRWQTSDLQEKRGAHHIPITRCSAVVALVLNGPAIKKVKNPSRRASNPHGYVYDPWQSWQVLNLQCYPDWNASTEVHDATRHYVNGVEAFLITVLGEFRDAQKRFELIYQEITKLITPPLDFMFDADIRDKLLFEDGDLTYSRRYFWASQTLALVNESIRNMIEAYEDGFTDEVWEGSHKTLWPLLEAHSARNIYFKKRMSSLRTKFSREIENLRKQIVENDHRREEILTLKEELFKGTSISESRMAVEYTNITIQQGHNIKLLTLVSIFFLPLTFVTSVFGMTNMPTVEHYWMFGLVTATVCIPFFILIGSLNTKGGMHFWRTRTKGAFYSLGRAFRSLGISKNDDRKVTSSPESSLDEAESMYGRRLSGSRSTSYQKNRDGLPLPPPPTARGRWFPNYGVEMSRLSGDSRAREEGFGSGDARVFMRRDVSGLRTPQLDVVWDREGERQRRRTVQ